MKVIALEEHYWDAEVAATSRSAARRCANPAIQERLHDLGALRLKEMDEAGIDLQVLSHGAPATQRIDAETAVPLARRANDRLHQTDRKASRTASQASPCCPPPTRRPPPTSSSAP